MGTLPDTDTVQGGNIMLGGIIFQLSELQFAAYSYLSILKIVRSCAGSFHAIGRGVLRAQRHR